MRATAPPAARPGRGAQAPRPPGCRPRGRGPAPSHAAGDAAAADLAARGAPAQSAPPPIILPPLPTPTATVTLVRHGQSTWNAAGIIQGSSDVSVLTDKGKAQAAATRDAVRERGERGGGGLRGFSRQKKQKKLTLTPPPTHPPTPKTKNKLAGTPFDALVHSPLARAAETASIIWAGVRPAHPRCAGAAVATDARLREIDLHSFQGLKKAEGAARAGRAYAAWQADPASFELDGTFPVRDLWARAGEAWAGVLGPAVVRAAAAAAVSAPPQPGQPAPPPPPSVLVVAHNAVNQALLCTALGLPPAAFRRLAQANGAVTEVGLEQQRVVVDGGEGADPPTTATTLASVRRLNDRGRSSPGGPDVRPPKLAGRRLVLLVAVGEEEEGKAAVAAALAAGGPWTLVAANGVRRGLGGVDTAGEVLTCEPADLWRAAAAAPGGGAVLAAGPPPAVEAALAAAAGLEPDDARRLKSGAPPFFCAPPWSLAGVEVAVGSAGGPAATVRFTGWRGGT
jgi:broad specificity phosphatase PhoE